MSFQQQILTIGTGKAMQIVKAVKAFESTFAILDWTGHIVALYDIFNTNIFARRMTHRSSIDWLTIVLLLYEYRLGVA